MRPATRRNLSIEIMARPVGLPKTGGRRPGSVNQQTKLMPKARAIAERLGVDPFEVLLLFSANRWKELGYDKPTETHYSSTGQPYELDRIRAAERIQASKNACDYLFPKLAATQITGAEGENLFQSFGEIIKAVVDKSNGGHGTDSG